VRLVLSAGDMDKRRTLFLTCGKLGEVSVFDAIDTLKDRHWEDKVAGFIAGRAKKLDKAVSDEAASLLIELNGANLRQIEIELEKLATYIGNRHTIEADDVRAVGCASRDAISWDLNDAVGGRNLRKALSTVDRLLFQGEAAIGLLFGLASHLRQLLILRELVDRKVLRPEREFPRVKSQLENIPANVRQEMPADKKLNPLLWNPYRTFKLLPQVALHSRAQLIRAIESLLETNQQMVTGAVPDRLALEELLARVITAK
jgi:DNA polymerase-3 subunit delta